MKRLAIVVALGAAATAASAAPLLNLDQLTAQCVELRSICSTPRPAATASPSPRPSPSPSRTPPPTQSPRPTPTLRPAQPTAVPTPAPTPSLLEVCPDGYLDRRIAANTPFWGLSSVRVPRGATRVYCAPVQAPILPAGLHPVRVTFEWFSADQDCALNMRVELRGDPDHARGTSAFTPNGNITFTRRSLNGDRPEQTTPGIYVVTVSGGSATCEVYRIGWTWAQS